MTAQTLSSGEGERLQRERNKRHIAVKGALFVIGMISGGYVGYFLVSNDFDLGAKWPPAVAVTLAIVYLAAVLIGSVLLHKSIDEVERMQTYKAVSFAGTAYMLVYPVWFLLWKAGFAIEPIHWLLFVGFWLLLIGGAVFYRFR